MLGMLVIGAQVVAALGIFNVWLVRRKQASAFRGGGADNLQEEFQTYGLPSWFMGLVGGLKLTFATLLLVGIWIPELVLPAALGLAVLMVGALAMHIKVHDPLKKSLPAATMLGLCLFVAAASA